MTKLERCKETRESFAAYRKGQLFLCGLGCAPGGGLSVGLIGQQTPRNFDQLGVATFFATCFGKCDPLNRAIAAHANRATKQCVTCHLPRNTAAIELENNFMTR